VDLLASEYGWTKDYIYFSVYPEDVIILQDKIMARQTDQMIADLRIISNPHLEKDAQKELVNELMARRARLRGTFEEPEIDRAALARLKETLKKESKAIKVK
jgi:hypothetical protein